MQVTTCTLLSPHMVGGWVYAVARDDLSKALSKRSKLISRWVAAGPSAANNWQGHAWVYACHVQQHGLAYYNVLSAGWMYKCPIPQGPHVPLRFGASTPPATFSHACMPAQRHACISIANSGLSQQTQWPAQLDGALNSLESGPLSPTASITFASTAGNATKLVLCWTPACAAESIHGQRHHE